VRPRCRRWRLLEPRGPINPKASCEKIIELAQLHLMRGDEMLSPDLTKFSDAVAALA
jgi:hypothetical protein